MNKAEFLFELAKRLNALPQEEINKSVEYYSEILDDLMEESTLGFVEVQMCLATLCAASLAYASGPGRYSAGL